MDHQDFVHDSENHSVTKSEVEQFYSGKTIFLTGVTGFLGKLIAEKLLRSCRDLKRIYLLVRSKKGKNINERYEELFAGPCMERLKREHPEFREKLSIMNGDLLLPNLGMSEESIEILKEEIEIVIHCAATTRLNHDIREATYINVRSLRDLILIAKNMKKLKSFLYISTAYSHCPRNYIQEELYDPPLKPEDLIRLVDIFDREKLNQITPSILGEWPNTYSFTKATAEGLIKQEGLSLPTVIVRPSIVLACAKEPEPGWIDSICGPTGFLLPTILGIIRAVPGDPNAAGDFVPADYAVNCILVAAYHRTKKREITNTPDEPRHQNQVCPVYNFCHSPKQPAVTWKIFANTFMERARDTLVTTRMIWLPNVTFVKNKYLYKLKCLQMTALAFIVDIYFALKGKEQIAMKGLKKIRTQLEQMRHFSLRNWKFEISNTKDLFESLNSVDQEVFQFDMEKLIWKNYMLDYLKGIRIYLIRDPIENLSAGQKHFSKLKIYHHICCTVLYLFMLYLIVYIVNLVV